MAAVKQQVEEILLNSPRKLLRLVGSLAILIVAIYLAFNVLEHVDQNQVMVIQSLSGNLTWYQDGGYHWQGFGKTQKFPKRSQLWFKTERDDKGQLITDTAFKVRFNDGGHGFISGSIAYEMPADAHHLSMLYQKYGSPEAIEKDLVDTVIGKSIYMTGPLMSSKESYAERRNDLVSLIEDQAANGVYQTENQDKEITDPITGDKRMTTLVHLRAGADGNLLRQEVSPLKEFGIRTYNFSIKSLDYDEKVEKQIQNQQDAIMQVQTSMANAKKAEQDAITAAKNGEAEAAKAKWEQEVIKARAVTEGQQKLEVAKLDASAADQEKQANILRGQGEAERRRLVMVADGALEKKLSAWLESQKVWATAFQNYPGELVPRVNMGTGAMANGMNNVQEFMGMINAKTAHDLSLSLDLTGDTKRSSGGGK